MACESLTTLQAFNLKNEFLTRFEGTDEGEVTTYLGCKLIQNQADRMIVEPVPGPTGLTSREQ
eukprot:3825765-Rhodomonas_salina.1